MKNINLHFSSKSNEWETPKNIFNYFDNIFHFSLDAAATKENALCSNFFTKEDDALKQEWAKYDNIWCNPPYGELIGKFIKKGYEESKIGCTVVFLIPARVETRWWHDFCANGEVKFIKGRLLFNNRFVNLYVKNSAPFPSAIVIFQNKKPSTEYIDIKNL